MINTFDKYAFLHMPFYNMPKMNIYFFTNVNDNLTKLWLTCCHGNGLNVMITFVATNKKNYENCDLILLQTVPCSYLKLVYLMVLVFSNF